ncbi:MAG: hydroxymyristoyl-ACP dehydratase [Xanthomonadales bacterium]|nr:hydroxymyristoyl-ACP dehydratase [Xanthomonadales bacterium]
MTVSSAVPVAFVIDATHPSLPGHFPGDPVVPGVVLLDKVAAALEADCGGIIARIGAVKFLAPLRPGEVATLHVARTGARVRFRIERAGDPIMRGDAELVPVPAQAAAP